ncbi:site-specific recombinase XerD (plasmid) [Chamaesiphon minutus PCC 6605]|uniref:Site-specific recombinase XerD n=2 Tax=Chamaesiphon TaxID=217161 RepID=K9UR60_CHAP6|nr:tyrosine-type recombinase/integrase [Chamaesiphon minutus]AFY96941.1 site-specific recombinase XerD [Chamaesiphon minutus PCC 6605]
MRSPVSKTIPVPNLPEVTRSSSELLAEFLRLKISANTQRNYSKAIADFCRRTYNSEASEQLLSQFLSLYQPEAVYQALQYRQLLIEAKLAPSTINVRLSALKSFVDYARTVEQCSFNLADVACLKVESYGDTTGIEVAGFREMLQIPDRSTVKGIRDYAILRLLWDNALRRNEICSLDMGDFSASGRLAILGKGKMQKSQIDLSSATTIAISQWLAVRDDYRSRSVSCGESSDPLFTSLDRRSKGHRLDGSTIYRMVRKFSESAGIEKVVSPHRIRHSAITAYLDASDGNIRAAQGLSRHANLNTLNRYDDNRHKYQAQATNVLADLV